jgi:hypothetical protein
MLIDNRLASWQSTRTVTCDSTSNVIDEFSVSIGVGAIWEYSVSLGTASRVGQIIATWNSSGTIGKTETSTDQDGMAGYGVGDSTDITFSVTYEGGNIVLRASCTGAWVVKIKKALL